MDPIGFRPIVTSGSQLTRRNYLDFVDTLFDFKGKYLEAKVKPKDFPPALEAYLGLRAGVARKVIPTDVYDPKELDRIQRILDPMYLRSAKTVAEQVIPDKIQVFRDEIRQTTGQDRKEGLNDYINHLQQAALQLKKVTSVDDFAKPEFASARSEVNKFFDDIAAQKTK